jgi:hypothetical protein
MSLLKWVRLIESAGSSDANGLGQWVGMLQGERVCVIVRYGRDQPYRLYAPNSPLHSAAGYDLAQIQQEAEALFVPDLLLLASAGESE